MRAELRDRASVLTAVKRAQGAPAGGEETESNDEAAERRIALFKELTLPLCKEFDDRQLLRLVRTCVRVHSRVFRVPSLTLVSQLGE